MATKRGKRNSASPRKRSGARTRDLDVRTSRAVQGGFLGKLITKAGGVVKPVPRTT